MVHRAMRPAGALIPLVIVSLVMAATARGGAEVRPDTPVPVLFELFTSEGCSSCPPADALLIELLARQPVGDVLVVGLSEHVDYWDRLGWTDPFSRALFTRRQESYAVAAGSNRIYTPQAIVDGHLALVGSDRAALFAAIRRAAERPKAAIAIGWSDPDAMSDTAAWLGDVEITLDPSDATAGAEIFLALVEDGLSSQVTRGENTGRQLPHAAVTRAMEQIGVAGADGAFSTTAAVDLSLAADPARTRVLVFAQRAAGRVVAIGMMER